MTLYDPDDPFAQGEIEARVKLGDGLLAEQWDHYEDAIDVATLELDNSYLCVLGQIGMHKDFSGSKDFHSMLLVTFPDEEGGVDAAAAAHGFDIVGNNSFWQEEYDALRTAWAHIITERKNSR